MSGIVEGAYGVRYTDLTTVPPRERTARFNTEGGLQRWHERHDPAGDAIVIAEIRPPA